MKTVTRCCGLMLILFVLISCSQRVGLAPVVEVKWRDVNPYARQHIIERGETLYAIAFRYDQDYRRLAAINHLSKPYTLYVGQIINLGARQPRSHAYGLPKARYPIPIKTPRATRRTVSRFASSTKWLWPINGRIGSTFQPRQGRKGIDILGKKGGLVRASAAGLVAYSGSGLSGYGNLIIIKHNNQYLTAYGNNARNFVKEGQAVKAGQAIAEVGVVNRRFWGVHFEIRKAGKPVNPLEYLQKG